jgi:hypothetical protein
MNISLHGRGKWGDCVREGIESRVISSKQLTKVIFCSPSERMEVKTVEWYWGIADFIGLQPENLLLQ